MGDDDEIIDSICIAEGWYGDADRATVRTKVQAAVKAIITDFLRYHVQDRALAVGMAKDPASEGMYESMKRNPETGRFYPIQVDYDATSMTVTDNMGNHHKVVTTQGLYNNICREYWFEGSGNSSRLFMGSDVVVHLIDGALQYDNMKPWRQIVREALNL